MQLLNKQDQYGWLSLMFHWITAVAVIGLFFLGLWMVDLSYYDDWYKQAPFVHKSIGAMLFVLTLLRLLWRWVNVSPLSLENHKDWEKKLASAMHVTLYLLLFSIMLSGYLISTADGRPVDVFNLFSIPALVQGIDKQEDVAGIVHLVLAIILITLVLIHAGAAIKHHFFDKDRTLKRIFGL